MWRHSPVGRGGAVHVTPQLQPNDTNLVRKHVTSPQLRSFGQLPGTQSVRSSTRSARARAASTARAFGSSHGLDPRPRPLRVLAERDVPGHQPRQADRVVGASRARPRRAGRGPPATAARRAAGSCPRSPPTSPPAAPRSRPPAAARGHARTPGPVRRAPAPRAAAPAGRRTPSRRRSPAHPCGRAGRGVPARRRPGGSRPSAPRSPRLSRATCAASVDLPAPGAPVIPSRVRPPGGEGRPDSSPASSWPSAESRIGAGIGTGVIGVHHDVPRGPATAPAPDPTHNGSPTPVPPPTLEGI